MQKLKSFAKISLLLGIFSVLGLIFSHLALTDIWHGVEANLNQEWQMVRIGFLLTTLFHVSAFVTLVLVLRNKF